MFSFEGIPQGSQSESKARNKYPVTIAKRIHLFPSRTQKLSSLAPIILGGQLPGKVGRCRFIWSHGQAVKTPPFHGGNRGSIPRGITTYARLAELADALDLGSSGRPWGFKSLIAHHILNHKLK